jgi:hypothetical protein
MANKIATKNPLFESTKDTHGNVKFTLNAYSAKDFLNLRTKVEYPISFQRYYLFINPPGGKGHPWQRNLFANMINYQPMGMIEWVTTIDDITGKPLSTTVESMDGQQRTKCTGDIVDNKVCLPDNTFIYDVDGIKKDVSGMSWMTLYSEHTEYVEQWLDNYAFIVLESLLTKAEKHKRFIDVNSQNTLSDQDKRSSLDNPLSNYLNEMVLGAKPWYNFLKVDTSKMEFIHIPKMAVEGKAIQEVIAKVLVFGFAGEYTNIGKTGIDRLYEDFNGTTKTKKSSHDLALMQPIMEEVLSTANYVIEKSSSKDFWKKRDIMILLIVLWDLISSKKKFDSKLLRANYIKVVQKLKRANSKLNDWALEAGYLIDKNNAHPDNDLAESIRERDNTFASTYAAGDSPITLEFVIETIKDALVENDILKTRDVKRIFTREQKQQVLATQDNKCACCYDSLDPDNTSLYEGDHIIPYSEGGKTTLDNCEILCLECHHIKTQNPESYKKMRKVYSTKAVAKKKK